MKITEASLADVPEIAALVNSAYRGDTSRKGWTTEADLLDGIRIDEEMLTGYFEDPHATILKSSDDRGKITSCVYLKKQDKKLYLGMLTVSPELQAKGIGKSMLHASEQKAVERECNSLVITVITSRTELVNWYKRRGYVETGEKRPFPAGERFGSPKKPLEMLVMTKTL